MPEYGPGAWDFDAIPLHHGKTGIPGNPAKGEEHALTREQPPFRIEKACTCLHLRRRGFVRRRGAAGGGADVAAAQLEPIIA